MKIMVLLFISLSINLSCSMQKALYDFISKMNLFVHILQMKWKTTHTKRKIRGKVCKTEKSAAERHFRMHKSMN